MIDTGLDEELNKYILIQVDKAKLEELCNKESKRKIKEGERKLNRKYKI